MRTIVCGIDGSPGARSALRVATELAEALDLRVVAVHVADSFGGDQKLDEPHTSPQGELEVAPPRIVEPSRVTSRMRLDAESDPFQASAGAGLSARSR
jgi:nucleotide-binding universal stress UspA family protein